MIEPAAGFAQEAQTSGGAVVGGVLDALHLRETPPPPADFVEKSRPQPETMGYRPLAAKPEPSKKRSAAQLDALGAELDAARQRNLRAARNVKALDAPARSTAK